MATMRDLRIQAGLKQSELAQLADVSVPSIYRLEKGNVPMKRLVVSRILNALSKKLNTHLTFEDVEGLQLVD